MFAGFITKTAPEEALLGESQVADDGIATASLEPGTLQVLLSGEDVKFSSPADVGGHVRQGVVMSVKVVEIPVQRTESLSEKRLREVEQPPSARFTVVSGKRRRGIEWRGRRPPGATMCARAGHTQAT